MSSVNTEATKAYKVALLLTSKVQLLDLAGIDLFGMLTKEYLTACSLPAPLVNLGVPVEIHYVGPSGGETCQDLTASAKLHTTNSIKDDAVAPGNLDVLMIPGPDPKTIASEEVKDYILGHFQKGTTILCICTGIFPVAQSGILAGKKCSGPRALVPQLKTSFPDAVWDDSRRYVKDGNLWTSGGITNGLDMVAAYLKEEFPGPLSATVCAMADVGERSLLYEKTVMSQNGFFLWQIIRAMLGFGGKKVV